MQRINILIFCLILLVLSDVPVIPQESPKISPRLLSVMEKTSNSDLVAWVFFKDKGASLSKKLRTVEAGLSPHAFQRRLRTRGAENLVDEYDLPVKNEYVREIARRVSRIRHESRWLNAVSVEADASALVEIARLIFVKKVDLVFRKTMPLPDPIESQIPEVETAIPDETAFRKTFLLDYGDSFIQNNQINVPVLHDEEYTGEGIIIAMLDSGFNNLQHEALKNLNIIAIFDFVNNDSNVSDEPGQMGSGNHGTNVLSVIGGYQPGKLIGPAYNASYALAKTENTTWERHIEEDHWVAGAEWADSLGADIISSSVGYNNGFTNGEDDYLWQDMDGNTTIVTIGADIAASRGILVVNSAGNEGLAKPPQNTLIAPADGDSVIAVGAVNSSGTRTSFSSMGPTSDGRIKPDMTAMGQNVVAASSSTPNTYTFVNGTSFSCPLIAGAVALIMEANPDVSNLDIIEALRETADNSDTPNNATGWGIANAKAASDYLMNGKVLPTVSDEVQILQNRPNPFNSSTTFRYNIPESGDVKIVVYNVLGEKVATLLNRYQAAGTRPFVWNAEGVSSGMYIVVLSANGQRTARKMIYVK
jgi:hypothetical protein